MLVNWLAAFSLTDDMQFQITGWRRLARPSKSQSVPSAEQDERS